MSKSIFWILAGVLLCLSGCAGKLADPPPGEPAQTDERESLSSSLQSAGEDAPAEDAAGMLTLKTPYIFAGYTFTDAFPQHEGKTLVLEMLGGTYDRSMSLWQNRWNGSFTFRYTDYYAPDEPFPEDNKEPRETVFSCPLNLSFNEPFELSVADYNGDGQPDFALSQFGALTGGDYGAVFTVQDNGEVKLLPIRAARQRSSSMFGTIDQSAAGEDSERYTFPFPFRHVNASPMLQRNGENGFYITYIARHGWDISFLFEEKDIEDWHAEHPGQIAFTETLVRDVYQWQEDGFVLARQEILEDDGSIWRSSRTVHF